MLFKVATISTTLCLASASVLPRQYGGYWFSCETSTGETGTGGGLSWDGSNYVLDATCYTGDGTNNICTNDLPLGQCLGFDGAKIVAQPQGNFQDSCSGCYMDDACSAPGVTTCLHCFCSPSAIPTEIDLNNGVVGNSGGWLLCNGGNANVQCSN